MVLATFLWGTAGVVTRQIEYAQGFEVTFWRSAFTVLALLVILPLWRGPGVWARIAWRQPELWLSGLCWAVMFTAFMVALTLTGVGHAERRQPAQIGGGRGQRPGQGRHGRR